MKKFFSILLIFSVLFGFQTLAKSGLETKIIFDEFEDFSKNNDENFEEQNLVFINFFNSSNFSKNPQINFYTQIDYSYKQFTPKYLNPPPNFYSILYS